MDKSVSLEVVEELVLPDRHVRVKKLVRAT